jgi:hypothetical protein
VKLEVVLTVLLDDRVHVIFYHQTPVRFHPTLRIPGEGENSDASESPPPYLGTTFASMCRLWTILQEVLGVYSYPSSMPMSARVPPAFAEGKYQKLLVLASSLSRGMSRTDSCSFDVMIFQ